MVCKLQKALYGLKQAPRAWYETFSAYLRTLHLHPLRSDYAVFINQAKTIYVAVYVDDLLIFGKKQEHDSKSERQSTAEISHDRSGTSPHVPRFADHKK